MLAYQVNREGLFVGQVARQKSPLEEGVWLVPAGAVLVAPPTIPSGKMARWSGSAWSLEDIPVPPPAPEPSVLVPVSNS
jgi:hypothetical protein